MAAMDLHHNEIRSIVHVNKKNFGKMRSLEDLCLRRILIESYRPRTLAMFFVKPENLDKILKLPHKLHVRILDGLLRWRKEGIFLLFEDHVCNLTARILDQKQTTSFDFRCCNLTEKEERLPADQRMWKHLQNTCPNLQKLVYHSYLRFQDDDDDDDWLFSRSKRRRTEKYSDKIVVNSIFKFKKLTHLDIPHLLCDNARFAKLANTLPNLRFLKVTTKNATTAGIIPLIIKLQFLEEFLFGVDGDRNYTQLTEQNEKLATALMSECVRLKPDMKVVGQKYLSSFHPIGGFHQFNSVRCPLGLTHLVQETLDVPAGCLLPEVVSVCLKSTSAADSVHLEAMPKLSRLAVKKVNIADLLQLLLKIGQRLTHLKVSAVSGSVDLDEIFKLCPRLDTLLLTAAEVDTSRASEVVGSKLDSLRAFQFNNNCAFSDKAFVNFPENLFEQIVQAPKLSNFFMWHVNLNTEELLRVLQMLKTRQVFPLLAEFDTSVEKKSEASATWTAFSSFKLRNHGAVIKDEDTSD